MLDLDAGRGQGQGLQICKRGRLSIGWYLVAFMTIVLSYHGLCRVLHHEVAQSIHSIVI